MGLDIYSKSSKKTYSYSYGGLHYLRWVAYKICDGDKDFSGFMAMSDGYFPADYFNEEYRKYHNADFGIHLPCGHYDWGFIVALQEFPNLMWHSDSSGNYTRNGQVGKYRNSSLKTGNSIELLKELKRLNRKGGKWKKECKHWKAVFSQLYNLTKDTVENGDGKIIFC